MPLNEVKCKNTKPTAKVQKLVDEKGMHLEITPAGGKYWKLRYRFDNKEQKLMSAQISQMILI